MLGLSDIDGKVLEAVAKKKKQRNQLSQTPFVVLMRVITVLLRNSASTKDKQESIVEAKAVTDDLNERSRIEVDTQSTEESKPTIEQNQQLSDSARKIKENDTFSGLSSIDVKNRSYKSENPENMSKKSENFKLSPGGVVPNTVNENATKQEMNIDPQIQSKPEDQLPSQIQKTSVQLSASQNTTQLLALPQKKDQDQQISVNIHTCESTVTSVLKMNENYKRVESNQYSSNEKLPEKNERPKVIVDVSASTNETKDTTVVETESSNGKQRKQIESNKDSPSVFSKPNCPPKSSDGVQDVIEIKDDGIESTNNEPDKMQTEVMKMVKET